MTTTLTIASSYGLGIDIEPRVNSKKFGDGYEQRQPLGLNTKPRNFPSVPFNQRTPTEAQALVDFFEATNSTEYFFWTPPDGVQGKFIVRKWSRVFNTANSVSVTATFEEVFEP